MLATFVTTTSPRRVVPRVVVSTPSPRDRAALDALLTCCEPLELEPDPSPSSFGVFGFCSAI
jgi:hypothetical protein